MEAFEVQNSNNPFNFGVFSGRAYQVPYSPNDDFLKNFDENFLPIFQERERERETLIVVLQVDSDLQYACETSLFTHRTVN